MEFRDVVRRRRMVRRFDQRAVPRDLLDAVLDSARHAPSAGFSQGMALVGLDEPAQVRRFWDLTTRSGSARVDEVRAATPPVIVLPLSHKQAYLDRYAEPDKAGTGLDAQERWPVPYWDLDLAMAVMLMLLTAVDHGLGGWFFGVFHGERELLRDLGVPSAYRPIGALGLGYPAPGEQPIGSVRSRPRRPLEDIVHRGRW